MSGVSLLGEQSVADDRGGIARIRSTRAVVLVAFPVVPAGSLQARQRVAGLLWPESTDAQALTGRRRELRHLRQVLAAGPSLVVASRGPCWRDTTTRRVGVRVFEMERQQRALERAIALAGSLGRTGAIVAGLAAVWVRQFVRGRTVGSVGGWRWPA